MKSKIVLDHYREVAAEERARLEAASAEVDDVAGQLMVDLAASEVHFRAALPTMGSVLVAGTFGSIETETFGGKIDKQPRSEFLSEVALPVARIDQEDQQFSLELGTGALMGCSESEWRFVEALEQVWGGGQSPHFNISVYHDKDTGTPLIFRKQKTESSGITLQPMRVGTMTVPSGTYVGVPRFQRHAALQSSERQFGNVVYETYEVDDKFAVYPLRLSPWAYRDRADNALFAVASELDPATGVIEHVTYDAHRGRAILKATLDEFREAATILMHQGDVVSEAVTA